MKIVFVCTGNIFRSMSAEYCAKKVAQDMGMELDISSAGTMATPQSPDPVTLETLSSFGVAEITHKQTKLSKNLIQESDLVIAMGTDHKEFIKERFGVDVPLFNELANGRSEGVLDIHEKVEDWLEHREATENHIIETVTHIYESMPGLLQRIREMHQ